MRRLRYGHGWAAAVSVAALIFSVISPVLSHAGEAGDSLPSVEYVLSRYIEALGGREALEAVETRTISGRFIDDRPYRGPVVVVPFEASSGNPGKWVMTHDWSDGLESEGFDGEEWWHVKAGAVEREAGVKRSKMAFHLDAQGPLRMHEYFGEMRVTGERWVNERRAYVVETDRDSAYYALYFDVESGLLTSIGYHSEVGDYRDVNGVKVPFRIVFGRKGGSNTYAFDEVLVNAPVDDKAFAAPAY